MVRRIAGLFEEIEKSTAAASSFQDQLLAVVNVAVINKGSSIARSREDFQAHVSPEVRRSIVAQLPTPEDVFRPIFHRAHEAGAFTRIDPNLAVRLFFMMLIGYVEMADKSENCAPGPFTFETPKPDEFVDAFLRGI